MAQNSKAKAASGSDSLSARLNEVQDGEKGNEKDGAGAGGPPPLPGAKSKLGADASAKVSGDDKSDSKKSKATPPPIPSGSDAKKSGSEKKPKAKKKAADKAELPAFQRPLEIDPADPVPAAVKPNQKGSEDAAAEAQTSAQRREAARRPAGPPRERLAANDDAPSIGGLIYALNQRPSNKPFGYAAVATGIWTAVALGFAWAFMIEGLPAGAGIAQVATDPSFLTSLALWVGPITLFWFLAFLAWRTEELHLRSSAMTEVAVRLAEPDRMAEQSVASLGQAVRRQVSFMNDAVSRALGRAGELEALVHNEVSQLEQSYEENERKIRGLIQELSGERHALVNTGDRFKDTLQQLGTEVPQLIERLSQQQYTLAKIIEGAGSNLTQLETALAGETSRLEHTLDGKAGKLQGVLEDYTQALATALGSRTEQMQNVLGGYTEALGTALGSRTEQMQTMLTDQRAGIEKAMEASRDVVDDSIESLSNTLGDRAETMQIMFEEYAKALDTTLANRTDNFDIQLVERTKVLDEAFSERLRLFDEAILNSALQIDNAVGSSTEVLTSALKTHAHELDTTLTAQASQLDETLVRRIEAVRSSSENISRQSIKAIEGLAGQSDMLRNVSENLLGQINNVSNRFESQSHAIMRSANALESANFKIDKMLADRSTELNETLEKMSHRADQLGTAVQGYSTTLEGSLTEAEQRAKLLTQDLTRETEERAKAAVGDMERMKQEASIEAERALEELRSEFTTVSREVTQRLGSLSKEFSQTTGAVREQAAMAAQQLEAEQTRLKHQMEQLPGATQESATAMRKALRDQLKALDQLSSLATATSQQAAAVPAAPQQPIPLKETPVPTPRPVARERPSPSPAASQSDRRLALGSLTDKLRTELQQRSQAAAQPQARAPSPAVSAARTNDLAAAISNQPAVEQKGNDAKWSFDELFARASDTNGAVQESEPEPEPQQSLVDAIAAAQPAAAAPAPATNNALDISAISNALDRATASAIWSRFRSGQRGFMVRSIYSPEGRKQFDDVVYRYQHNSEFHKNVDRFLLEFEQTMRDTDERDSSGDETHALIMSDAGRVYLLLAHAAKRLV
ncbi:MAG: hypothetical protein AAGB04_21330 [Pseudomonadota bacterium]